MKISQHKSIRFLFGLVFFVLFIGWVSQLITDINVFKNIHNIRLSFTQVLKAIYYSNSFIEPLILFLAITGFWIKKPIGWFLQLNFFLFFILYFFFILIWQNPNSLTLNLLSMIIPASFVVLLNIKSIAEHHQIKKSSQITIILITLIIALGLTFLKGYLILNKSLSPFQIIEKINS